MSKVDCKPMSTDVVAPRIPMVVAVVAVALSVFALLKVMELELRVDAHRD